MKLIAVNFIDNTDLCVPESGILAVCQDRDAAETVSKEHVMEKFNAIKDKYKAIQIATDDRGTFVTYWDVDMEDYKCIYRTSFQELELGLTELEITVQ